MSSVETTEEMSKAVQQTPHRVALDSMKAKIKSVEHIHPMSTPHMTISIVTMENGWVVIGKSAPADPGNFDAELGRTFAEEDAIRQLWQLEGYLLREKLHNGPQEPDHAEETQTSDVEAETDPNATGEGEAEPQPGTGETQ